MSSYEPLFLKYRPQSLSDVLGQSSVKETLIHAINNKKIVHAYLLTGPRGSGKTSTARIIAKSLNCTAGLDGKSPTTQPCGSCDSCVSITNSASVDVTEIDAASHGGVEDARTLIEKVNLASVSGKYRVYIIDEVHMLSKSAFNALLKVIEEPPNNVVFILATTELHKVLETISSRCQQLRFNSISPLDCLERLEYVSKKESINIEKEALESIASHADGAMRDALSLLDQVSVFSEENKSITEDKVLEIIGAIPSEELQELTESILLRNAEGLIAKLNSLLNNGKDSLSLVQSLSSYFLDILEELNSQNPKEKLRAILAILKEHSIENYELVQILDSLAELEIKMKSSVRNKNLLKAWLIKICHRADILVVKELLDRVKNLESGTAPRAAVAPKIQTSPEPRAAAAPRAQSQAPSTPSPQPRTQSPEPRAQTNPEPLQSFLDYLSPGSKGMFISSQARLIKVDSGIAYVEMPDKFKFLQAKLESRAEEFLSAISKDQGSEIKSLKIELAEQVSEIKEMVTPRLETTPVKETIPTKALPVKPELQESTGEACATRTQADDFMGALQKKNFSATPQETKLNETVEAALTIFGGKEL